MPSFSFQCFFCYSMKKKDRNQAWIFSSPFIWHCVFRSRRRYSLLLILSFCRSFCEHRSLQMVEQQCSQRGGWEWGWAGEYVWKIRIPLKLQMLFRLSTQGSDIPRQYRGAASSPVCKQSEAIWVVIYKSLEKYTTVPPASCAENWKLFGRGIIWLGYSSIKQGGSDTARGVFGFRCWFWWSFDVLSVTARMKNPRGRKIGFRDRHIWLPQINVKIESLLLYQSIKLLFLLQVAKWRGNSHSQSIKRRTAKISSLKQKKTVQGGV